MEGTARKGEGRVNPQLGTETRQSVLLMGLMATVMTGSLGLALLATRLLG